MAERSIFRVLSSGCGDAMPGVIGLLVSSSFPFMAFL
jgi:hypothetical protein